MIKNYFFSFLLIFFSLNSLSQNTFFDGVEIENFDSLSLKERQLILQLDSTFKSCLNDSCKYNNWQNAEGLISGNEIKIKINQKALDYISKKEKETDSKEAIKDLKYSKMLFLQQMGTVKREDADNESALEYLSKAMDIAKELNDTSGMGYVYNELAFIHQMQDDFEGADKYFRKDAALNFNSSRTDDLMVAYFNIAYIFAYRTDKEIEMDSAIFYLRKCLPLLSDSTPVQLQSSLFNNIGMSYYLLDPPLLDSANKYITLFEKLAEKTNSLEESYFAKNTKASIYDLKKEYDKSEKISLEVLEIAEKLENNQYILESLEFLFKIQLSRNKHKEAVNTQIRISKLQEKLWKEKDVYALSDLEAKFKYQSEIDLNKEKAESLEKESLLKSNIIYLAIGSALLIALALVFLYINRRKLNKNKLRLEELDKVNKQIFSVIAHDFKEPIINFNLLLKDIEDKKSLDGEFVNELESQVKSSNNVLNNLLNWARIELEKQEVNKKNINLNELWNEVVSTMETSIKKKALTVKNLFKPSDTIEGDAVMMEIVFRNLLSNAIKFSPNSGTITARNQNGKIEIVDEGIGMPDSDKIFKEKVNTRYGTNGESGFGIGLFIVNNLLGKNDKTISFSNNSPKGTIFSIQDV